MGMATSLWRRGRRRYGLPVMLLLVGLVGLAVYDGVTGPYPLASLVPLAQRILPRNSGVQERPTLHTGQGDVGGRSQDPSPHNPPASNEEGQGGQPRAGGETQGEVAFPEADPNHHRNHPARPHPAADVAHLAHPNDLSKNSWVHLYSTNDCTGTPLKFSAHRTEHKCTQCFDSCRASFSDGTEALNKIGSFQVVQEGGEMPAGWSVSTFSVCGGTFAYSMADMKKAQIHSGVRPESGCIRTKNQRPNMLQFVGLPDPDQLYDAKSYHVVYSCESSTYFAYQAYANYYAFLHSKQQTEPPPAYTRLLTSSEEDDLSVANGGRIPTFTSPREPFSRTYSPYNKPTGLTAFMEGPKSPKEDVIIIIDPDNWLVQNLGPIASKVSEGNAVATAAFYDGNPLVTELYQKHICENACDFIPDTVAVPYFVHREDAKKIAPLWKIMTKKVWDFFKKPGMMEKYNSLQPGWCAEMYGYVYAAAELRVKHTILPNLQHRDVDGKITMAEAEARRIRMIHMGRAWFEKEWAEEHAARWIHRPRWEYSPPGTEQVWCKCNATAADERPWPIPPNADFTTNVTLTLLHESLLEFGNAPRNKYRSGYSGTYE